MADYATKNEVQSIVNKAVDDLSEIIQTFAQNVDERFDHLGKQVDKLETQFDRLNNTLDSFLKRLDDIETTIMHTMRNLLGSSVGLNK